MLISSVVLVVLYLGIRYLFKRYINYTNSLQEIIFISAGTIALISSVIGNVYSHNLISYWVGLAIIAVLLIQFPLIIKLTAKIPAIIISAILMVLVCIPYVQLPVFIILSGYLFYLAFKTRKITFVTSAIAALIAPLAVSLINLELVYYAITLYLATIHFVHTKSLLEMMKNAGKNVITDQLTGLYNRRWLFMKAKQLCAEQDVGFIFFDIDNFKILNDTKGHEYGDQVLKQVGDIMNREMKGYGYAARYGGEELVAITTKPDKTLKLAEKILEITRKEVNVTMSIGVAVGRGNAEELIKLADERMYISKTSGKNRVTFENNANDLKSLEKIEN